MNTQTNFKPEEFEDPLSIYEPEDHATPLAQTLADEPVSAIKAKPYLEIPASTTVGQAVALLDEKQVGSLLVVADGQLQGIFTERDVLERVADQFATLAEQPVTTVMTADPLVVYEDDPSGTALAAIAAAGYRHVPVLNSDDQIVGVISPRRVFAFLEGNADCADC